MAISLSPARATAIDDVVIVGAGLAGLYCALKLAPRRVTLLASADLGIGASSTWAQGGIAAAVAPGDTAEQHLADTLAAGAGLVDEKMARLMVQEAPHCIDDLLRYGVPFDRDLAGALKLSREAAHSQARVVRVAGDKAGGAIMAALIGAVRTTPSIRVLEGVMGETLLTRGNTVTGLVARPTAGGASHTLTFETQALVLATGGIGHLYAVTTNPPEACGSGLGMAARAGAAIRDAEFVQFHPTAMDVGLDPAPLLTEALRGEGAVLVDSHGRRFMPAYHPLAELAPRDVVARAVHEMTQAGGAFLDARCIGADFATRYPTVYAACRTAQLDPTTDVIPIAPAAHYHMGGVATDANGRTTLDRLWACGEVACTGVHGANRLASNSLLEAVVFANRVAQDIKVHHPYSALLPLCNRCNLPFTPRNDNDDAVLREVRRIMQNHVGVVRSRAGLQDAERRLNEIRNGTHAASLHNSLVAAGEIVKAALARPHSCGAHGMQDKNRQAIHA